LKCKSPILVFGECHVFFVVWSKSKSLFTAVLFVQGSQSIAEGARRANPAISPQHP
jgi:hypothetical protein